MNVDAKNILVMTGSPRKGGNSDILADAFIKGASAAGHEVSVFRAAADVVNGCRACDACWSKGKPCVFPDGFEKLFPLLEKADVLVLCTPIYWFGFSAQIKSAIDKFYSYGSSKRKADLKIKETVLLLCAEDTDPNVFNGAIETYKGICDYKEWKDRGIISVMNVNAKGDINGNEALAQAEQLGSSI